jgi:hypothetical protein
METPRALAPLVLVVEDDPGLPDVLLHARESKPCEWADFRQAVQAARVDLPADRTLPREMLA